MSLENEYEPMELVCETDYDPNAPSFGDMNFYALLSFKYNGEFIQWDYDLIEELAEAIDNTYAGEKRYNIINNTVMEIEINDEYDTELEEYVGLTGHNSESRELIREHLEDAKKVFQRQLFSQIDFQDDIFEQYVDNESLENDELFDLYLCANNKIFAKEFADKNGYEWEF